MESRGYQNLYPDLSPTKEDVSSFSENKESNDEEEAFCRDLQKAKALSLITAQQEERQRQLDKAMINSSNGSPVVPILKPPPRQPRQYFDGSSEVSKGLARPKPAANPPTGETSNNAWTNQANNLLNVDAAQRSHSVPPFFKNDDTVDTLNVDSNRELIQLSPAVSDRSSNIDFDVRQLDPLYSGSYRGASVNTSNFHNLTIPKSSESSNAIATIPRKNFSFTSGEEIGRLSQTNPGGPFYGFMPIPVDHKQIPPPLPAKAPRGQWRDPWGPAQQNLVSNNFDRSFPDINKPVLPPRITYPPTAPTRLSLKTQGYHPPLYGFEAHMLPSPITSNNFLSFANNNVPFVRYGSNDALTFGQQLDKQTSDPLICSSERQTPNDNFEVDEANNVDLDVNGDLIHFPDNAESTQISNPTYMSLADFDPLFEMKSKTSQTAKTTSEDGPRKSVKAPPICPRRKVISLPSTSSKDNSNIQYPNVGSQQRISVIPASWSFSQETSFDRPDVCTFRETDSSQKCFDFDWEDPNDPFSLCHLVRRSQKYQEQQQQLQQQQQQQQQQQLWHKNDSVTSGRHKQLSCLDNSSQPPAVEPRKVVMRNHSETKYSEEFLEETPETADEEIRAFLQMVARIKLQHPIGDQTANSGIVVSPQTVHKQYINLTVKVIVLGLFVPNEIVFVCDVNSTVEHVIIQVLMILIDDKNLTPDAYMLKVFGYSEYLINKSLLSDYEYVQKCLKLGKDIKLIIEETEYIQRPFLRTIDDINHPVYVPKMLSTDDASSKLTMNKINILLETFYKECEKLKTSVSQAKQKITCLGVVQSVKAICMMLNNIQTVDVTKAVKRLKSLLAETENTHSPNGSCGAVRDVCIYEPEDSPILAGISRQYSDVTRRCIMTTDFLDDLQKSLNELSRSVKNLIDMFCRTFHKEFRFKSFVAGHKETCDISTLNECLLVHLAAAHRIPNSWRNVHSEFYVQCRIFNGGHQVGREAWTQAIQLPQSGDHNTLVWDEWLTFDEVRICDLPREAKLCFNLIGCRMAQNSTNEGQTRIRRNLAWVAIQLFNHQFELVQGDHLLGMWSGTCQAIAPTTDTNTHGANSLLLQMSLQNFDFVCLFPKIEEMSSAKQDFDTLHPDDQSLLMSFIDKDPIVRLSEEEKEFLWQKRHYLYGYPSALPKVLQTITSWAWYSLSETYTMVRDWSPLSPMQSLQLLLPRFSDTIVRCIAVDKLRELPADDFCDLLPQLIQALKFEFYHTSALARLLLERSATSVRVAHQIYWLLKDAADDVHHKKRYQLMFGALMSVVGEKMRQEFGKQEELVNMLSSIADKVKAAKDRDAVLQRELCNMWDFLQHKSVRLPTNPGLEIAGVDVKSCSFFTSFTVPLKLAFRNVDPSAGDIYVMFKAGDDLRQDALTLQMIRIMDRLWLQGGLELKMVTFKCLPTSPKKGFVELIPESDTLGKIQKKHGHGVTGSFKDRPIAEWLQMHNPSELDYQAAVDNFTASCAGYCVATYILGVCDRHNDNIMIKHSGHIFHIDYAKFLGDLQMLGAINRDRTPFILTSDMAYVINGGDKPTEKFQKFVDLCCHALNIVRRNSGLFINLFSLMTLSGIPRVNENAPRYVREAMMPERSDAEAIAEFTRMVNTSLKSIFTQFNFFIHNLAQLKFSGHDEGMLLSFVPKTYSINTDGRIKNLELHGIQKRYNPEKFYIFIVRVERVNQKVPNLVLRRFSEFQELHRKLVATFPLVQWPSLSGKVILGRAHVKAVAESRRAELEVFLKSLLKMSAEVAEHDLIYTFFHPMLRDEQENKTNLLKLKELPPSPALPANKYLRHIEGFIKLSIFHKMHGLTVMVMHVKDLGKNSSGELPSPYVKLYLLPDPMKLTKRKTKIAKNTAHPTYNEMLIYRMPLEVASQKVLQVTVWSYDGLKENEFLGGVHVRLGEIDLTRESVGWHKLLPLYVLNMSST